MAINVELANDAEKIARRLAKEAGQPEELWELFLMPAYDEITTEPKENNDG